MTIDVENSFNISSLNLINVNLQSANERINEIFTTREIKSDETKAKWLLKAISMIDLTTLAGDDTETNVKRLCYKAANPLESTFDYQKNILKGETLTTAAVCVYPSRVADAARSLAHLGLSKTIQVAAVATGFPTGQYPLATRLAEIRYAVESGATEIDVVIDRSLVLAGKWAELFDELVQMRKHCSPAHMKVILAIGELGTMSNVYKSSMVAMYAGCDFIKTSTGKEGVNATLVVGLVMCRAIRQFEIETGKKIGFKPAGGIRTHKDALNWLILIKEELGDDWLNPQMFRFGASGLLGDIEKWLYEYGTGISTLSSDYAFI